jgi:heme A synthase
MLAMAIQVLWFLIGIVILAGVVWLAIYIIETMIRPIPERVKQGVWLIVLLLALIFLLTALMGGGVPHIFR